MLIGGVAGVVVVGGLTAWLLQAFGSRDAGLEGLLHVLLGAALGSFVGGGAALWIAFRHENRSSRVVTVLAVVLGGPLLFFPAWEVLAPVPYDVLSPQLVLAVSLVITAVAGRWISSRWAPPSGP